MNNSKKMIGIIEKKKELNQKKTPKYGTRKLSIGLVSCMLGFSLIVSPGSSKAAEETDSTETEISDKEIPETPVVEETQPAKSEEETTTLLESDTKGLSSVEKTEEVEQKQADTFIENLKTLEVEQGQEIDYKQAITNLPQDAKIDVLTPVDTKEAGEKTTNAKITFSDGSEKEIQIKVNVKAVEVKKEVKKAKASNDLGVSENKDETAVKSTDVEEVQKKAIYSPGTKGQKKSYSGKVYIYDSGDLNDKKKGVGGVNVYLQWVNGKGVTSPVYYTTSNEDGTFTIDLTKTVKDKAGKEHGFKLAGDEGFVIRTWADNPDSTKYNIVKHGDEVYGFHNRLNRVNESWDFTAGINRIVNGEVALQEKPRNEQHVIKDESEWQKADTEDGAWANEGLYGTVRGRVWYETGDPVGGFANYYGIDSNDIRAAGTKVVASYLNDDVTNQLDAWKKANKGYTKEQFRAAQKEIIAKYEAEHGKGSHIAETVVTTVDSKGNYYIPFRGLYGVSSTKKNNGASIKNKITDEEFGTLVKDEDITHKNLAAWNTGLNVKARHINEDYMYVASLVDDYGVYSNTAQTNMFDDLKNGALTQTLEGSNISQVEFAIIHPQTVHDITNYDTTKNYARKGDVAETETGGLLANREYLLQWFREGKAIGDPITVKSDANGKLASNPFTVPDDVTEGEVFTSAIYLPGANTKSLQGALAMDSFITTDKEDEVKNEPVGKDITVEVGGEVKAEDGIKNKEELANVKSYTFKEPVDTSKAGDVEATVIVEYEDGTKDEVPVTVKVTAQAEKTADNFEPAYTDADAEAGKETTITVPNFTDKDGKEATKPEGTKFALGEGAPEGAIIDENTGEIKYTPTESDAGKEIDIPVVVTYPDNSTDNVVAKVTVADTTPVEKDADKYDPTVSKEEIEKGGDVDLTDNVKNLGDLPEGTKVEDVTPEGAIDTNTPGDYTGKIKVTYPDGSSEEIEVPVTVKDTNPAEKDADKYDPTVEKEEIEKGGEVDLTDNVSNLGDLPEGTKVEDVTPEGAIDTNTPGDYTGKIKVTYPDGSSEEVEVPVTVKDTTPGQTDAEKIDPSIPSKTEVKDKNNLSEEEKDKVKKSIEDVNKDKFPEGTKVTVEKDGSATITYPDGSKDTIPGTDLVSEKTEGPSDKTDAEKIDPSIPSKTEVKDKNNLSEEEKDKVKKSIEDANKDKFPEGTKVTVGKDGSATITYPDGSKDTIPGTDLVSEKTEGPSDKTDAESNPAVIPGKTTVKDKNNLTEEEKAEIAKKVKEANPKASKIEVGKDGSVIITYPDGSKNTIAGKDLIVEKSKAKDLRKTKTGLIKSAKKSTNVNTGIESQAGIIATLLGSVGGLFISKKRKNK